MANTTHSKTIATCFGRDSYYRKFLKKMPGPNWTKHVKMCLGPYETAFQNLKIALTTAPVLTYPFPGDFLCWIALQVHIIWDTYSQQIQNGIENIIANCSCSFHNSERIYCVTRKELSAIIEIIKQFHNYFQGRHFQIRSDHATLKQTLHFEYPESQLVWWVEWMHAYDFEMKWDEIESFRMKWSLDYWRYKVKIKIHNAHDENSSVELISKLICDLKVGKTAGYDGIAAEHLLHCHPSCHVYIIYLCNLMLLTGYVPSQFGIVSK